MELPRLHELEFSPLAWKEWLLYGKGSQLKSRKDVYESLEKLNREHRFRGWAGLDNRTQNKRIKRLLNGYVIFDLLDSTRTLADKRMKIWRLFEDLVGEVLRNALTTRKECTVVYVGERWPGFKGLDYIITNSESDLGWKVGVQCKRYISNNVPYGKVDDYSSYSTGTTSSRLYFHGKELRKRFSDRRKMILIAFSSYRSSPSESKRFENLKEQWDSILIFDRNRSDKDQYTYKIDCPELEKIVRWC
jgi:hypothetical protein